MNPIVLLLLFVLFLSTVSGESSLRGAASDAVDSAMSGTGNRNVITRRQVVAALDAWARGLVSISTAKANNEDYVKVASDFIRKAYNYDKGIVLFKPTVAAEIPFRTTFEGALSYFVGGNPSFPEDNGFGLLNWKKVDFGVVGIVADSKRAVIQTTTLLTQVDDTVTKVYFSMGFSKDRNGDLKIDLHHSSLPPSV